MKYNPISRRMFLQGAGAFLTIPLLESLAPLSARAATMEPIKRYLYYYVDFDHGHNRNWLPQLTDLSNVLAIPGNPNPGTYDRLSTIMTRMNKSRLSQIFGPAFNPFIDQMMFYKGLDIVSHGYHCVSNAALGCMDHIAVEYNYPTQTIDYFLAKNVNFDPGKRAPINLRGIGTWEKNALGEVVKRKSLAYTPYDAYKIIFNNGDFPESDTPVTAHPRRDILSRVLEDYNRVINGKKIGTSDKVILTNAMDSISDLQKGLQTQVSNQCKHKDQDPSAAGNNRNLRLDDALTYSNYVKLITAIFNCDISRVITFSGGPSNIEDWTGLPTQDYHGNITHALQTEYGGKPNWLKVGEYYGDHFSNFVAPLLSSLDSCIDPSNGKSFLHNGLVHLTTESVEPHRQVNMPTVTVGSLNGVLPTGYMVNYTDKTRPFTFGGGTVNGGGGWDDNPATATDPMTDKHSYDYPGIPYQRFLVTLLQAMGLSPADYEDASLNKHMLNLTDSRYGEQNNGITYVGGFGISSLEKTELLNGDGMHYHHDRRMRRYNWHYYKDPIPLPPKV